MKKAIVVLLTVILSFSFAACGTPEGTPEGSASVALQATEQAERMEPEPESGSEAEATSAPTPSPTGIHPYAWLGLQDMPHCNYLDFIASQHYLRVVDFYVDSYVVEKTEAVDGLNTYSKDQNGLTLNLDGMVYSFNDASMIYMTNDMTAMLEDARQARAEHVEKGINEYGRVFQNIGQGAIPLYADATGDTSEYEYYEYLTGASDEAQTASLTERFYMKDGDVFAIYSLAGMGDSEVESTEVIKSITSDLPEDILALPANFDAYTLYE